MATDVNLMVGELMNSPIFWVMACVIVFLVLGQRYGWFKKLLGEKKFVGEPLKETLMKDLKPRLAKHGKKVNAILIQNYHSFGKVKRYCEGEVKYWTRTVGNPKPNPKESKMKQDTMSVTYFLVGGNPMLSWIPYIGKKYEPDYYVINSDHVKYDPSSETFYLSNSIHLYPYAEVWVSDVRTQRYLTELEARRTQEFEAETNINTLKRWTYYDSTKAGRITFAEKEADIEKERWKETEELHE